MTLNPGMIDSILYYDADASAPETRTYVIYYNQPLNHSQAGSVHFPLRALITVHRNDDPTQAVNHVLASGYSIMEAKNVKAYGDTVYAYMFDKSTFSLDNFPQWIDTLRKYPEPNKAPVRKRQHQSIRPFGITYDQWWENDTINAHAYEYQAKCELGYFDFRFDLIISDPAQAAEYNSYWKQHAGCLIDLENPFFRTLTFSPALYSATMSATQNATKPKR